MEVELRGRAESRERTSLRSFSLVTGKNTGNFDDLGAQTCPFRSLTYRVLGRTICRGRNRNTELSGALTGISSDISANLYLAITDAHQEIPGVSAAPPNL